MPVPRRRMPSGPILPILCALALQACASVGPAAIGRDRVEYAQAVARSAQREMLLNIVKLRFGDTPTLSSVGQIVAGYSVEGRLDIGTDLATPRYWLGDDISLGLGGTFSDRPTITYNPIRGGQYVRMLLTPLPPYELIAMMTSGAPADAALRLAVKSLNGVAVGAGAPGGAAWRAGEALSLLDELRAEGVVGIEFEGQDVGRRVSLVISETQGRLDPRSRRLLDLLHLDPARRKFPIVFGVRRDRPDKIALYTRSLVEILNAVAAEIEVPDAAVRTGQTYPSRAPAYPPEISLRITAHPARPEDAFAAVEYGGAWYAIDAGDFASKRVFGLLMILAAVMETSGPSPLPVITIPSG